MKLWQVYRLDIVTSPSSFDPLDYNVATDSWVSVHFKYPFLMLLVLYVVYLTFLELKTSNWKCTLKNGTTYPCSKFLIQYTSSSAVQDHFFNMFVFTVCFSFWYYSFRIFCSIYGIDCATIFGPDCMGISHSTLSAS